MCVAVSHYDLICSFYFTFSQRPLTCLFRFSVATYSAKHQHSAWNRLRSFSPEDESTWKKVREFRQFRNKIAQCATKLQTLYIFVSM